MTSAAKSAGTKGGKRARPAGGGKAPGKGSPKAAPKAAPKPPAKAAPKPASNAGPAGGANEVRVAKAEFAAGAASGKFIPPATVPEIAFAGRSNVGKSSLLNMMLARRGLARTSRTPGCTRQINFFDVGIAGGPSLAFVDLPGYGYAKVSKSESLAWKGLLEGYLRERETLRAVVVLVDVRRGLEQEERDLVEFLGLRPDLRVVIAATKLDKLPRNQQKPQLQALARAGKVRVFGTSAETRQGREELWAEILRLVRDSEAVPLGKASRPATHAEDDE